MTVYQSAFKNARVFLNVSLRKLALLLKVDAAYVSRIESDKQTPSLALIKKLEALTNLSFWALAAADFATENQNKYIKFIHINLKIMQIDFNEMSAEDRADLREKFSVEIKEFNKKLTTANDKLGARVEKSTLNEGELEVLETKLQKAQANLTHLKSTNAAAEVITDQEEVVAEAEKVLRETRRKGGILTDQELVVEVVEIKEVEALIKVRQDMITDIDAIP